MAGLSSNPLFTRASRKLREAARQAYRKSDFGQLLKEFERAHKHPAAGPRDLGRVLKGYQQRGAAGLLRELERSDAGRLARDLERYARSGGMGRKLVEQVYQALGSGGVLLRALSDVMGNRASSSSRQRAVESAIQFLNAFGYEVLPPPSAGTPEQVQRAIEASQEFLKARGKQEKAPPPEPTPEAQQLQPQLSPTTGRRRTTVDVSFGNGLTRRFKASHPIVTGAMVPADSSNVYAYGYDVRNWLLYVRFREHADGQPTDRPGPLYQYRHVQPEVFLSLLKAGSKGNWVWDKLRIRGTVSGHRYDYALVGISGGYVPRKAVYEGAGQEAFQPREVLGSSGQRIKSSKPYEVVRPVNRGRPNPPNNGGPNRGRPNRGRP